MQEVLDGGVALTEMVISFPLTATSFSFTGLCTKHGRSSKPQIGQQQSAELWQQYISAYCEYNRGLAEVQHHLVSLVGLQPAVHTAHTVSTAELWQRYSRILRVW